MSEPGTQIIPTRVAEEAARKVTPAAHAALTRDIAHRATVIDLSATVDGSMTLPDESMVAAVDPAAAIASLANALARQMQQEAIKAFGLQGLVVEYARSIEELSALPLGTVLLDDERRIWRITGWHFDYDFDGDVPLGKVKPAFQVQHPDGGAGVRYGFPDVPLIVVVRGTIPSDYEPRA